MTYTFRPHSYVHVNMVEISYLMDFYLIFKLKTITVAYLTNFMNKLQCPLSKVIGWMFVLKAQATIFFLFFLKCCDTSANMILK